MVCTEKQTMVLRERERVSLHSICLESQPMVLSVQRVHPWSFFRDGEPMVFGLS